MPDKVSNELIYEVLKSIRAALQLVAPSATDDRATVLVYRVMEYDRHA
jgi:hypothetical protein